MSRIFEIPNTVQDVESTLDEFHAYLEATGVENEAIHDLRLVTEELLLNTVSYGYNEGAEDTLTVSVSKNSSTIVLEFRDRANPFNPLQAEERDPDDDRIGGWGIQLMKELTDSLHYSLVDGENILVLKKNL